MILKPPLAEAQIALGKQKNTFCGTRVSVSLPKFCVKLLPRAKFHWNHAVGCWVMAKIRFSIRRVSAISRIFKNVIFGHVTVIDFQMCCCVSNFIEIGMIFLLRSGDLTTCNMAAVRRVEISKYSVYVTWRLSDVAMLFCFTVQDFTEIGQLTDELWPKTTLKMTGLFLLN